MTTLWVLAAPGLRASRARLQAIAAGTAVAGALLMVAADVFRVPATALPPRDSAATTSYQVVYDARYSSLVTSAETRIGVATAVLLLAGTALLLAGQAVTSGSARRRRRHDALATAGATPAQLRRLGALEAGAGGLAGGVLAGPVHLLLWFLLGPAQPPVSRLLPDLAPADAATWAVVVIGSTAVAAAAGAWTATVRSRRRVPGWVWALVGVAGVVLVPVATTVADRQTGVAAVCAALTLVLVGVLGAGRPWVTGRAARMRRSDHPDQVLAAGGLSAVAGSAGRAAGVLVGAGLALGVAAVVLGNTVRQATGNGYGWVVPDHLPGVVLAATAAGIAALAALTTLTLTAVDDVHSSTRALAALAAAGADLDHVQALQRRRLRAVTLPPLATGLLLGGIGYWALGVVGDPGGATDIWPLLVVGPAAVGLTALGARGVTALLRSRTADALQAGNLRAA